MKNNDNGSERSIDDDDEHCEDDNKNDVISAEYSFLFKEFDTSTNILTNQFKKLLLNANVQILSLKMEYNSLQDYVKENCKTENMHCIAIWRD